jgi:hypothetical protein
VGADHVRLSAQTLAKIEDILSTVPISGSRYNPINQSEVDTEQFAV